MKCIGRCNSIRSVFDVIYGLFLHLQYESLKMRMKSGNINSLGRQLNDKVVFEARSNEAGNFGREERRQFDLHLICKLTFGSKCIMK